MKLVKGVALLSSALLLAACGGDDDDDNDAASIQYPSTYAFDSKVVDGASAVKYTGQTARQLLIDELKKAAANADVTEAELKTIYTTGTTGLDASDIYGTDAATAVPVSAADGFTLAQNTYTNVLEVAGAKDLAGKTAGCDNELSASQFIGWTVSTYEDCGTSGNDDALNYHDAPYTLVQEWLTATANGNKVNETLGLDYSQLLQKFLLGAVAFSQTAEDYLAANHTNNTKGLQASNAAEADTAYTDLGHAWDEGFGYFGASVDYLNIDDATINAKTNHSDVNGDYVIDLLKGEYNYGLAQYASKHDVMTGTTDLSNEIMVAFLEGRQLILDNHGTTPVVGDELHTRLEGIADRAIAGLEKVIAISVVKYINQTIEKLDSYVLNQSDVSDVAKYWSELKGFALGLQFNPNPTMTEAQQIELHAKIGESPIKQITDVHNSDKSEYVTALEEARTLVQEAYGFDATAVTTWGL